MFWCRTAEAWQLSIADGKCSTFVPLSCVMIRCFRLLSTSCRNNSQCLRYLTRARFHSNSIVSDHEVSEVRKWLSGFTRDSIPRRNCEVSFSRSSGPGGQNVNKLD